MERRKKFEICFVLITNIDYAEVFLHRELAGNAHVLPKQKHIGF